MPQRIMNQLLPDSFLVKIGDIVTSFASLESQTQKLAELVLNDDQHTVQIITAELSFKGIRGLVSSLFAERGEDDNYYKEVKLLMKRCELIEEERNRIIHSTWGVSGEVIVRLKTTAKSKFNHYAVEYTVETLAEFATKIKLLSGDILSFYLTYLDEVAPSSVRVLRLE